MSIYLGIDPGKKGAFAILNGSEMSVECFDMPSTTAELHDLIKALPIVDFCVLEHLFAGPEMGVKNVSVMFENYGILKGALAWRGIGFDTVRANKWKPALGLSKDKNASREKAMQLFPDDAQLFKRVKDDGRAEAVLIAYWAMHNRGKLS